MLRALAAAVMGLVLFSGTVFSGPEDKQKDPPRHLQGTVTKVDQYPEPALTITVKERQPTDKEDIFQEVDRDHRFRIGAGTQVLGMDGKPDKQGLKSLQPGDWVRVEYQNEVALEVKKMPPR